MDPSNACVIFNPRSGRRNSSRQLDRIRRLWSESRLLATQHPGHAEELAAAAASGGASTIVAIGGDGTVHEVANGLLRSPWPDVTLAIVPVGSANDYAWSLQREFGAAAGDPRRVDVGLVRDSAGRTRYFLCGLGAGLNGAITFQSRRIRRLRGVALYGLAALRALRTDHRYSNWEVRFDAQEPFRAPSLMLSIMLGRREGNFRMAPSASVVDGVFDYVHAGALPRWRILRHLPRLALIGPPTGDPEVRLGRCRRVVLKSDAPLFAHADGELLCTPQDGVVELEIELLPRRLNVQLCLLG